MKHFKADIPSTNSWLMSHVRELRQRGEAVPDLWAVYTDFQSHGRGAGHNTWHSTRGCNILTSICFDTGLAAGDQFLFNLWFATATRAFLSRYVPDILIKWPNDMYVHDRKLAGDLTEHAVTGGRLDYTVAGIGINVNEETFPREIPNPTSLFLETGVRHDIDTLMDEYLEVLRAHRRQLSMKHRESLREEYISHLYRYGEPHRYRVGGEEVLGIIRDIDHYGRLVLEHHDGSVRVYEYKQIAYLGLGGQGT